MTLPQDPGAWTIPALKEHLETQCRSMSDLAIQRAANEAAHRFLSRTEWEAGHKDLAARVDALRSYVDSRFDGLAAARRVATGLIIAAVAAAAGIISTILVLVKP